MNATPFDALTRSLLTASSRRDALRLLVGALLGGGPSLLGQQNALARCRRQLCRNGTCEGCCTAKGCCKSGTSAGACGTGGGSCTACRRGDVCCNGECKRCCTNKDCGTGRICDQELGLCICDEELYEFCALECCNRLTHACRGLSCCKLAGIRCDRDRQCCSGDCKNGQCRGADACESDSDCWDDDPEAKCCQGRCVTCPTAGTCRDDGTCSCVTASSPHYCPPGSAPDNPFGMCCSASTHCPFQGCGCERDGRQVTCCYTC